MQAAIAANRFLSASPLARAIGLDEQIKNWQLIPQPPTSPCLTQLSPSISTP